MEKYDVIVIGSGSGLRVSAAAAAQGKKVAVIEPGPMGGTCLNRGCIPSKMLIYASEVAQTIKDSAKYGIDGEYKGVRFKDLTDRVSATVDEEAAGIEAGNSKNEHITLYKTTAKFTGPKTLKLLAPSGSSRAGSREVEGETGEEIEGDTIVIAAGTRPFVPPIPGIDTVEVLTSDNALRLAELPKSMVIVGGGVIAAELASFFGILGTEITVVERAPALLGRVDAEIGAFVTEKFKAKFNVLLNRNTAKVEKTATGVKVTVADLEGKNEETVEAEKLLVVAGRTSNTDLLDVAAAGIEIDERKFIKVDDHMRTNVDGIWALGDIAGKWGLKHKANVEAEVVTRNAILGQDVAADYQGMPYAVFTVPQVAAVGHTEEELKTANIPYKAGKYLYKSTGMGQAFMDEDSFVKVLVGEDDTILGAHIVGPEASTLIHEVALAMAGGLKAEIFRRLIVAHPALSEVVQRAFLRVQ